MHRHDEFTDLSTKHVGLPELKNGEINPFSGLRHLLARFFML